MARMTPNHEADCCCEKCVCEKAESEQQLETVVAAAAKKLNEAKPSPPAGLPTEAPTLDEQIAYIGESIDGECGRFMCRHNRAILASLEELQRLKSTPVAAEGLIRRLEDSRDNACLEGSVFHRLFSDCIAALRAPAAKGMETGRWVPWKPGDALPATAPVLHWTTWFDKEYTDEPMMRANYAHDFERWCVIAYWSVPLPPPFAQGETV